MYENVSCRQRIYPRNSIENRFFTVDSGLPSLGGGDCEGVTSFDITGIFSGHFQIDGMLYNDKQRKKNVGFKKDTKHSMLKGEAAMTRSRQSSGPKTASAPKVM